ncbi:MAG TPA: hypothetical protein VGC30_08585 [Dokdonella sp.]
MPLTPFLAVAFAAAALSALVALHHGVRARRYWRARRRIAAGHRALWSALFLLIALLGAGFGATLLGYRRLSAETPVATVDAQRLAPQRYAVTLSTPDGSERTVEIDGDEWQLDARVIKWKAAALVLGAPPLYRLERIGGRYRDVEAERGAPRSVHALLTGAPLDLWTLKRRFPAWLPWIDADYGSAAYLPLVDGGRYEVTLAAAGGLVARPDAATAARLQQDGG